MKTELIIAVKERFDKEGIEIPFPHVSLYAGEISKPIMVQSTT
jgi:small-conductance mechanosensitive channel